MINWIKRLLTMSDAQKSLERKVLERDILGIKALERNELEIKDPSDYKKTDSSTNWVRESYCINCDSKTSHNERMTQICLSCGKPDRYLSLHYRSSRNIWDGYQWVTQVRCSNGNEKILTKQ